MTRVLHNARISDVDSSMFVNRIRKMVSFELGKEIRKDVRLVPSIYFLTEPKLTIFLILVTNLTCVRKKREERLTGAANK